MVLRGNSLDAVSQHTSALMLKGSSADPLYSSSYSPKAVGPTKVMRALYQLCCRNQPEPGPCSEGIWGISRCVQLTEAQLFSSMKLKQGMENVL